MAGRIEPAAVRHDLRSGKWVREHDARSVQTEKFREPGEWNHMSVEGVLKRKQQHREQGIQRPEGGPLHFRRALMPALMHRSQTIHVIVAINKA